MRQQQQVWWKDCFKTMEGRINPLTAGVRGLGLNSDANRRQFEDWSYGMEAIYSRSDQDYDSRDQRRRHSRKHETLEATEDWERDLKSVSSLNVFPIFLFVKWGCISMKSEVTVEGRTQTVLFGIFRARITSVLRRVNEAVKLWAGVLNHNGDLDAENLMGEVSIQFQ